MNRREDDPAKKHITACLRAYLLANDAVRKNPCGWQSCPPRDTPIWKEYALLSAVCQEAESQLWMSTDIEYDDGEFRDAVWSWRHAKVMARKCCWYQRFGSTRKAGATMRQLHEAETRLVEVCGLIDIYRSASSYIEEAFPKLRLEREEAQTAAGKPTTATYVGLRQFVRWLSTPYRAAKQWLCGKRGHVLSSDRGHLLGSNVVDKHCGRCGKHIQIPLAEEDYDDTGRG